MSHGESTSHCPDELAAIKSPIKREGISLTEAVRDGANVPIDGDAAFALKVLHPVFGLDLTAVAILLQPRLFQDRRFGRSSRAARSHRFRNSNHEPSTQHHTNPATFRSGAANLPTPLDTRAPNSTPELLMDRSTALALSSGRMGGLISLATDPEYESLPNLGRLNIAQGTLACDRWAG